MVVPPKSIKLGGCLHSGTMQHSFKTQKNLGGCSEVDLKKAMYGVWVHFLVYDSVMLSVYCITH